MKDLCGELEEITYLCIVNKPLMTMQTVFNQAQLELLDMMSFVKSPKMLSELMQVVSDYFARQAEEEIDRLWENGTLNETKVEGFRHLHERTPYK